MSEVCRMMRKHKEAPLHKHGGYVHSCTARQQKPSAIHKAAAACYVPIPNLLPVLNLGQ